MSMRIIIQGRADTISAQLRAIQFLGILPAGKDIEPRVTAEIIQFPQKVTK